MLTCRVYRSTATTAMPAMSPRRACTIIASHSGRRTFGFHADSPGSRKTRSSPYGSAWSSIHAVTCSRWSSSLRLVNSSRCTLLRPLTSSASAFDSRRYRAHGFPSVLTLVVRRVMTRCSSVIYPFGYTPEGNEFCVFELVGPTP